MRTVLSYLIVLIIGVVLFINFWPRPGVDAAQKFDPSVIGEDIDAYLAESEAGQTGITQGVEKRMIWAGEPGVKTRVSVVYLHGFSATSAEIQPVPEMAANAIAANVFLTRLTGHGQSGEDLAAATSGDWMNDMREAVEIGRRTGDKVVVLSTSTGGSLAALGALDADISQDIAGIAFVSPNFALKARGSSMLDWPFAESWVPTIMGATRSWEPSSEDHAKYWTTAYPTQAVFPMARLVGAVQRADFAEVSIPAYFVFSDQDTVVDAAKTREIMENWGGPVTEWVIEPGEGIDKDNHVILGDIMSPALTQDGVRKLIEWMVYL